MSLWNSVTAQRPCHACGKADWCSVASDGHYAVCRRVNAGGGRAKLDKSGSEYWVYRLNPGPGAGGPGYPPDGSASAGPEGRPGQRPIRRPRANPAATILPPAELHEVYRHLLNQLKLEPGDRRGLEARGLTPDQVLRGEYRTLGPRGRRALASALVERFGEATVARTPGLYRQRGNGPAAPWTVGGPAGVIVPIRNLVGEIIALKVRRAEGPGPKYLYLSSAKHGGPGSGAPVHVPRDGEPAPETVRLTEGELKADVATALDGFLTVSISGVAAWRSVIPTLHDLGCRTCRLAFDMDVYDNVFVATALKNAALQLIIEGFQIELELWDPAHKGIDDCLREGSAPRVIRGGRAYAEALKIFKRLSARPPEQVDQSGT